MMHAYLTFVALLAANFAITVRSLRNPAHHEVHRIQKRQEGDACLSAIQEAQEPQFIQCSQFIGDATTLSFDQILSFCVTDNCVPLVKKVFTDLEVCNPTDNSTGAIFDYIDLICTQNSYGVYCLELLDDFDNGQLQLPYTDIDQCDASQPVCSNACKNVADWVESKLGCCYLTAVIAGQVPEDYILPDGFFTNCGTSRLTACQLNI